VLNHDAGKISALETAHLWSVDTRWFDVALVSTGFAVGSILFGRFEEHRPRWRRVLELGLVLGITLVLAQTASRVWAYGWMMLPAALAAWAHLVWLPRHGINGWTAEPRERYRRLMEHARLRDLFRLRA
jgi:hypothetical protein